VREPDRGERRRERREERGPDEAVPRVVDVRADARVDEVAEQRHVRNEEQQREHAPARTEADVGGDPRDEHREAFDAQEGTRGAGHAGVVGHELIMGRMPPRHDWLKMFTC